MLQSEHALEPCNALVCDLDGTLLNPAKVNPALTDWLTHRNFPFFVATGRCFDEARALMAHYSIPSPDVVISDVGTQIHWAKKETGFRREYAFPPTESALSFSIVDGVAKNLLGLAPQGRISCFKISYFGSKSEANLLEGELEKRGVKAVVVHSHEKFIDVLAEGTGKGYAVDYACRVLDIDTDRIIAVGDSCNDLQMLTMVGCPATVANASSEFTHALKVMGARTYAARSSFGDGVREAYRYYSEAK